MRGDAVPFIVTAAVLLPACNPAAPIMILAHARLATEC